MTNNQIVCFSLILFFALAVLSKWLRRREQAKARVKRGLHSYVTSARYSETAEGVMAVQ